MKIQLVTKASNQTRLMRTKNLTQQTSFGHRTWGAEIINNKLTTMVYYPNNSVFEYRYKPNSKQELTITAKDGKLTVTDMKTDTEITDEKQKQKLYQECVEMLKDKGFSSYELL